MVYLFTIHHVRELKFDNKQPGSAIYLVCFRPGTNWGPCACDAHVMPDDILRYFGHKINIEYFFDKCPNPFQRLI